MKKNKGLIIIIIAFLLVITTTFIIVIKKHNNIDTIKYKGETYYLLEYKSDVFMYDLSKSIDYTEDEIKPIKNGKYKLYYFNGDIFCDKKDLRKLTNYYQNDNNYNWYMIVDSEDEEIKIPLDMNDNYLDYFNKIETKPKKVFAYFEELEEMGSIIKVSKDSFVTGTTSIAKYQDKWYWRTEIINEDKEIDGSYPEYLIELPEGLV